MKPFKGIVNHKKYVQGLLRSLSALFTFQLLVLFTLFSGCDNDDFQIPEPPSFDWKASIYQNPVPIAQITEPVCDTLPRFANEGPPFDGYTYYHQSVDPVVWKIKLNKSRRDMIAYITYHPDLDAEPQQSGGYAQIQIKDLISGEIEVVDQMTSSAHLGFDFAGDYLIYERNFEGYLYNWKTKETDKLGVHMDHPSISPKGDLISYHDLDFQNKGKMVIVKIHDGNQLFSIDDRLGGSGTVWLDNETIVIDEVGSILKKLKIGIDQDFVHYLGPFDAGLGFLVDFSADRDFLYGNNYGVSSLNTLTVNVLWKTVIPENCQNRKLANFFILPDNTFMMRKTYYISDHEKRTVHPEYHWHLFDADGSNERRVELQL